MPRLYTLLLLMTLAAAPCAAQSFSIAYQTPDALVVCGADTLTITVQNNTATPLAAIQVELTLPSGLEYMPGTNLGANELNITNLAKPLLTISNLVGVNMTTTVRVQVRALCSLVDAINNNQLFTIGIKARFATLENTVTTTSFVVETPLLVITQIDNDSLGGERDDVFYRTIHVRNTRLGAVQHLYLRDAHNTGIDCHVAAAAAETEVPTLFAARFDGSFFTAFGDGDDLFEYNETVTIVEEVRITSCGVPAYFVNSTLSAEWSCTAGGTVCQADGEFAEIFVKTATKAPVLVFTPTYGLPWSYCATDKSVMKLKMVNTGVLPAENVLLEFNSTAAMNLGMDKTSFRLRQGTTVTPITPSQADFAALHLCQQAYAAKVTLSVPFIAPGDSVELSFDAYFCATERCDQPLPVITVNYFYAKPCPPSTPYSNGTVLMGPGPNDKLVGLVTYNLEECLQPDSIYDFAFALESRRLAVDTGFVWFTADLPWGLFWSTDCQPKLDGVSPSFISINTLLNEDTVTRVLLAFPLPLADSVARLDFCLQATCLPDAEYTCGTSTDCPLPDAEGKFTIFSPRCGPCGYRISSEMAITRSLNSLGLECAVSVCDESLLQTACDMVVDTAVTDDACLRHHFSAARVNLGLPDADNDRVADGAGTADAALARRDRFMPGDTLEAVIGTQIVCGDNIDQLFHQLFVETARSDAAYANAGDLFDVSLARWMLTDPERFRLYDVALTIWDSSANAVYQCTPEAQLAQGRLLGAVSPVNVYPKPVDDNFTSMSHLINADLDLLATAGCVPPGFRLAHGDSVELRVRYKLDFNFAPPAAPNFPPLVNFELGLHTGADQNCPYNYRRGDTLMLQYTGFYDTLGLNVFGIRPCDPSTQIRPFVYRARLARENFFPYEVRPLSRLVDYQLSLPGQTITPLSVTLKQLRLQEAVTVAQNVPINYTTPGDTALQLDFAPFYQQPLDEGYNLETNIVFAPNCRFTQTDSARQTVLVDYYNDIQIPGRDTASAFSPLGFFSNQPRDTMTTNTPLLEFPTAQAVFDVQLKNTSPVPAVNYWVRFVAPDGGLTNFSVVKMPGATPVSAVNGIFQVGILNGVGQQNLRITATNTTCEPQALRIYYGWNCTSYTDAAEEPCGIDSMTLTLVPLSPELELNLVQFPPVIPLCDTSDYLVIELSNADVGNAYEPYLDFQLPASVTYVPGSFQLAYPATAAFAPIADPAALGSDTYGWQLAAVSPAILADGLPGVAASPANRVLVRFKVKTGCGAVSNGQVVVGTGGKKHCGEPTNTLRKASAPLLIEGFAPSYSVQLGIDGGTGAAACSQQRTLNFVVQVSGPPTAGDSVYIQLPAGFGYVAGSYVPGANAAAGTPTVLGSEMRVALSAGLPPNTIINFSIDVLTPPTPLCTGAVVTAQARQRTAAFCEQTGGDCSIYVATGEAMYEFPAVQPALTVNATTATLNDGTVTVTASFINPGATAVALSVLEWWRDVDGDGTLSAPDTLVYSVPANLTVAPGGVNSAAQAGLPDRGGLCALLLVAPVNGNCLCAALVQALPAAPPVSTALQACQGTALTVGVPALAGHTYQWAGNAPCTGCASFDFLAPSAGTYAFTLTDQSGNCQSTYQYTVQIFPVPVLLSADTALCRGQGVLLSTGGGVNWQWSGPGLTNPAAAVQIVAPSTTTTYAVTITGPNACTTTDAVTVAVLDTSVRYLGIVRTCAGTPVDVLGELTEVPGTYCRIFQKTNGCDSTICLTLEVVPGTSETMVRCPDETVFVFGEPVTAAGTYCRAFPSSLGCDSLHCVQVTDLPDVVPAFTDTTLRVAPGRSVQLPALPGYAAYAWSPAEGLSCSNCASPEAMPPDSLAVYTLTLTNAKGCTATATYRVLVLPPCDPESVQVPNAFTPNGDGHNDVFRPVVVREGQEIIGRFVVFNRWGQPVLEASGRTGAWDGTVNGELVPADVYLWLLEIECGGSVMRKRGEVSLLR